MVIEVKKKNILPLLLIGLLSTSCSPTKTYNVEDYRTVMKFHDNFKILQLTDLHFGIESNLEEQTKFIEILKYKKVSTFEIPKNCLVIVTCSDLTANKINEEVYSLLAQI